MVQAISPGDYRPEKRTATPTGPVMSAEQKAELRQQAKDSLMFFAFGILGFKDLNPRIHGPICKLLEGKGQFFKIVLPRTFFKSSLCTVAYPIWKVINNPNLRICIVQNTQKNADKKLKEIGEQFTQNQVFRDLFPELMPTKAEQWTNTAMQVPRTLTAPEATFEAAGVRTKLVSRHFDILIEDDTVCPDEDEYGADNIVPTKDDIGKAIGFHKAATPLFVDQRTGISVVVGTRWFDFDLMSYIDREEDFYVSYERGILEDEHGKPSADGSPVWPERFPSDVVDKIRKRVGPYIFSTLYLNKPISSANQTFQLEWFKHYDVEPRDLIVTTTVDPGGDPEDSKGEVDYNVVCTVGKDLSTGIAYVLEVTRFTGSPSRLLNEIHRHVDKWNPVRVGIETQAYQKSLLHWNREMMRATKNFFVVEPIINNRRSKNARIVGLQPLIEQGNLRFRTHQMELVTELLQFPNSKHDDMADALAMQLPLLAITRSKYETQRDEIPDEGTLAWHLMQHELEHSQERADANPIFGVMPFTASFPNPRFN